MKFTAVFSSALLLQLAKSHVVMYSPMPYNDDQDNSPLAGDGSNFPCKLTAAPQAYTQMMTYTPGQTNQFQLKGSAVHGGGSCQISITYDNPPTKNSVFKVVQSYEGGCPVDTAGNLPENAENLIPAFDVTLPEGIKSGQAVFVWSWFNKIGNREMYMNCAPINIAGSETSTTVYDALPDMFVANIQGVSNGCSTTEGIDIVFPNPGTNKVVEPSGDGANFGPPVCPAGGSGNAASSNSGNSGQYGGNSGNSGQYGSGSGAASSAPASYAAPSPSAPASYAAPAPSSYAAPSAPASYTAPAAVSTPAGYGGSGGNSAPVMGPSSYATPIASTPAESTPLMTTFQTVYQTVTAGQPPVNSAPAMTSQAPSGGSYGSSGSSSGGSPSGGSYGSSGSSSGGSSSGGSSSGGSSSGGSYGSSGSSSSSGGSSSTGSTAVSMGSCNPSSGTIQCKADDPSVYAECYGTGQLWGYFPTPPGVQCTTFQGYFGGSSGSSSSSNTSGGGSGGGYNRLIRRVMKQHLRRVHANQRA